MKTFTLDNGELVCYDLEIYPNYFLAAFKGLKSGKVIRIEMRGRETVMTDEQKRTMIALLCKKETFGFNNRNFDDPISAGAISGFNCYKLFKMCNDIIMKNTPGWLITKQYELSSVVNRFKTFDVAEPAPGVRISLKLYGARMHYKTVQDLPIKPATEISESDMDTLRDYCENDLDTTIELFKQILPMMTLRRDMSEQYQQCFMSKGDAQIAEMIIKDKLNMKYARRNSMPEWVEYNPPKSIKFMTPQLQDILKKLKSQQFKIDKNGNPILPAWLKKDGIQIGPMTHTMGLGGLHSVEKYQILEMDDDMEIIDADVVSYYPFIILNTGLEPKKGFLDVFRDIVQARLDAKARGDAIATQSLKICINGTFGKLGSSYSFLYSPDLMLATTLTGQLALLMLIEALYEEGIHVFSSNTDGVVAKVPKDKKRVYLETCKWWEKKTGFELEYTYYKKLVSSNVNNYFAETTDGEVKTKGTFAKAGLRKNPAGEIIYDAVREYFLNGTSPVETIKFCDVFTKFITVRGVTGGAYWKPEPDIELGKVIRWYHSTEGESCHYIKNDNKVPTSDGSRPVMTLPEEFPSDIDYDHYVMKANDLINKFK